LISLSISPSPNRLSVADIIGLNSNVFTIYIDSSAIVDAIISQNQRELMQLVFLGDAINRNKVNLIIANEITPHLTAEEYMDKGKFIYKLLVISINIYVYIYTCIYIHVNMHIYVGEYKNELKQVIGDTKKYIYIYTYIHIYTYIYTHTYI
jgi:hypothetical protein